VDHEFAGRWPSLRASVVVAGCPTHLRGPRGRDHRLAVMMRTSLPSLPFRAVALAQVGTTRPSLLGFVRATESRDSRARPLLSIDIPMSVHSHTTIPPCFGRRGATLADPVPSSRFRTAPTGSSAHGSRACCIPLPILRFAAFRTHGPGPARRRSRNHAHGPRDVGSYPSKDVPSRQPHHVTVAVALLPFQ